MNKKKYYSIFFIALFLSILPLCKLAAQETKATHAESMSKVWNGMNVDNIVGNDEYATNGRKFYLFNVGTGRFVIEGGNWGMEGRLFHESFGRPLYLMKSGFIKSGITEKVDNLKDSYGCNVPGVSNQGSSWSDCDKRSFTVMMDADRGQLSKWDFQRVETDPTATTYTYYMWEEMSCRNQDKAHPDNYGTHKYYLGAAWGDWYANDGRDNGKLVFLDDDRSCWTTEEVIGNTTEKLVNGDMISIDKLYQWRLVPEEEFLKELKSEKVGLNPSISCLVPDRDFTRNADGFDDNWVMEEKEGHTYGSTGRRGFTSGIYKNKEKQKSYYLDEAWDKPVRLKEQFEEMKKSKYGYLFFEGVGRTYTQFKAPCPGWFLVQCYGFVKSDGNNDAYLFAKVGNEESRHNLVKINKDKFAGKDKSNNCLKVGEEFMNNGENYKNFTWIFVDNETFDENNPPFIQIGVGKDAAYKRNNAVDGTTYYYDGDWVCIDDIRVSYMGLGPVFFYEEEENLDYLTFHPDKITQFPSAVPDGRYSGAACLQRNMKVGNWNSFSFPIPLTGEQVRFAFGEGTVLAKLHSIGNKSRHSNVIDFESVNLRTTTNAVVPGEFYLLKPTEAPYQGKNPHGDEVYYYELGRNFFSINDPEEENYNHPLLSQSTVKDTKDISSFNNENDGVSHVNYVQTPGYSTFRVNSSTYTYTGSTANGIYATKGSYAVSNNTIYHLAKDTPIKGFRGWITVDLPLQADAKPMTMCIDGIDDTEGIATALEESFPQTISTTGTSAVYDLSGRKVGNPGTNLSKGLYIVNGKKYLVR